MNPKRKQRLIIILAIVAAVAVAATMIGFALRENINAFYSPTDIKAGDVPLDRTLRVGGLVVAGSLQRGEGLNLSFEVTDKSHQVTIHFDGMLPDLFREGQGIIAIGKFVSKERFEADEVLAKHDEEYTPPEVKEAIEKAGHPAGKPTNDTSDKQDNPYNY